MATLMDHACPPGQELFVQDLYSCARSGGGRLGVITGPTASPPPFRGFQRPAVDPAPLKVTQPPRGQIHATPEMGLPGPHDPIPAVLLGRLAVDRRWRGIGLGADLPRDAVPRARGASERIGVRAILVHAISPKAKAFHERRGFRVSPIEPMTLMITMAETDRVLSGQ